MARRSTTWKYWLGLSVLGSLSVTLAVGWWLGHRAQSAKIDSLRSRLEHVSSEGLLEDVRSENDDLIRFVDESYTLLREEGIHIQLDLDVDQDGHYRLRADSAKLTDELKAKLRELNEPRKEAPPND